MNEGQISRVLHLLERIAAALERAQPANVWTDDHAFPWKHSSAKTTASNASTQMTAGPHDPI